MLSESDVVYLFTDLKKKVERGKKNWFMSMFTHSYYHCQKNWKCVTVQYVLYSDNTVILYAEADKHNTLHILYL